MPGREPVAELQPQFSSDNATATPWEEGRKLLRDAGVYWLSTVRSNGQPHVTTIAAIWLDESLYFSTGPTEQKARNLEQNTRCAITTGCNSFDEGLDLVIEGEAMLVTDERILQRLADEYLTKYHGHFNFKVKNGAFTHEAGGTALVFQIAAEKALGFIKGEPFSQTRWRF